MKWAVCSTESAATLVTRASKRPSEKLVKTLNTLRMKASVRLIEVWNAAKLTMVTTSARRKGSHGLPAKAWPSVAAGRETRKMLPSASTEDAYSVHRS